MPSASTYSAVLLASDAKRPQCFVEPDIFLAGMAGGNSMGGKLSTAGYGGILGKAAADLAGTEAMQAALLKGDTAAAMAQINNMLGYKDMQAKIGAIKTAAEIVYSIIKDIQGASKT